MKSFWFLSAILLILSACGYRFQGCGYRGGVPTISIPYVVGDTEGELTNELIRVFAASGDFTYLAHGGVLELKVAIIDHRTESLGWKYNRNPNGSLTDDLVSTEARRTMMIEVTLLEAGSGEIFFGPSLVETAVDYDYYEPDSIQDLSFITAAGIRQTSVHFSLGQLDSTEGAYDSSTTPISRKAAKKILDRIIHARY